MILRAGLQVDLRVVPEVSYGAALHYFTGSQAHNIAIRRLGQQRHLKINEYGVFRGQKRGYRYLAITDHSQRVSVTKGLATKRLARQIQAIDDLNGRLRNFVVLKAIEVDILDDGALDSRLSIVLLKKVEPPASPEPSASLLGAAPERGPGGAGRRLVD